MEVLLLCCLLLKSCNNGVKVLSLCYPNHFNVHSIKTTEKVVKSILTKALRDMLNLLLNYIRRHFDENIN